MSTGNVWYMAIDGQQIGPVTADEVIAQFRAGRINAQSLIFGPGLTNWTPLAHVQEFAWVLSGQAPPSLPKSRSAHEIDYKIYGEDMQFVEIELDPNEAAVAEAGAMMFMTQGVDMDTIFGDGSQAQKSGLMGALLGAGKRLITGESLFTTVFTNKGGSKARVAFAAPYAGRIVTMDLQELGGTLICQKDSFLCAAKGVSIGIAFQKKIGVGLFGGEGFIMQKLEGDGLCFVHAGGMIHPLELSAGEQLRVDTGCLVALQPSVSYDIQFVGKVKTALFGGEGIFNAVLTGPGKVWLQSLPLSRLADRIYRAAPGRSGNKEEGSILNAAFGLGDLLDGKN